MNLCEKFVVQVHSSGSGWSPVYVRENLSAMSVGFLLTSLEQAVIWKGPRKDNMIKQFLLDVDWGEGELDYLIVDTPPGTSDEHLSVVNYLKNVSSLAGCILVTTPQEISLQDVRKEISFVKQTNLPVLGIIENMSIFRCGKCHKESEIFPKRNGIQKLCESHQYELLASIPIDPCIARCCDDGQDLFENYPDSLTAKVYLNLAEQVQRKCQH
jgi:Mrp family chromosome partitioning ATPase